MPGSRLCRVEREQIAVGLALGRSLRSIAAGLGRAPSTVSREVARNRTGRGEYWAYGAQREATRRARRPKAGRFGSPLLAGWVRELLEMGWSPAPIAAWLRGRGYQISAETIYRACYRNPSPLGPDAWRLLARSRPSKRRRRRTTKTVNTHPLGRFRPISQRPNPTGGGHWEGDLIVGAENRSAAVVLSERHTRYTIIGALQTQTAPEVAQVLVRLFTTVPEPLRQTLTWDQGRELAHWTRIEQETGLQVFFCQPRSPWQKPLVENTCGLLRRWLGRKTNLYRTQTELDTYAHILNTMPRRIHNWNSAQTRYDQLRVATTM